MGAIRRCGELLAPEDARGKHWKSKRDGTVPLSEGRTALANANQLTERERKALFDEGGPLEDMKFETVMTYGWVAKSVTTSIRIEVVTWKHHRHVAWVARSVTTSVRTEVLTWHRHGLWLGRAIGPPGRPASGHARPPRRAARTAAHGPSAAAAMGQEIGVRKPFMEFADHVRRIFRPDAE